uniref:Raftlin family member 2 n=2 Tax=Eptatretus burgeri TaxID=7764 RepID=A0A8C4QDQ7_EPTBU
MHQESWHVQLHVGGDLWFWLKNIFSPLSSLLSPLSSLLSLVVAMGCGLRKMEDADDASPGKIFSTLNRQQVETPNGVSYDCVPLDFTTAKLEANAVSIPYISGIHELPAFLDSYYRHGYTLAAVHPTLLPHTARRSPLEQLYRAVLIRALPMHVSREELPQRHHLVVEECPLTGLALSAEAIKSFMKKALDTATAKGYHLAGFVSEYLSCPGPMLYRPPTARLLSRDDGQDLSAEGRTSTPNVSGLSASRDEGEVCETTNGIKGGDKPDGWSRDPSEGGEGLFEVSLESVDRAQEILKDCTCDTKLDRVEAEGATSKVERSTVEEERGPADGEEGLCGVESYEMKLYALYNVPETPCLPPIYYMDGLPLRVTRKGHAIATLEADWLDHLSKHLEGGASLVDSQLFLSSGRGDRPPKSINGLLIFEENPEVPADTWRAHDVIVVEQLTVIKGCHIKTDYIPLLHTLAELGWRLTSVLPTPVVKPDSEGNLVAKQIVFLQRQSQKSKEGQKGSKKNALA